MLKGSITRTIKGKVNSKERSFIVISSQDRVQIQLENSHTVGINFSRSDLLQAIALTEDDLRKLKE